MPDLVRRRRFAEEGAEVHFLTRLWGQASITFSGHEWHAPFTVDRSLEDLDHDTLRSYSAVIVPSGMVSQTRSPFSELSPPHESLGADRSRKNWNSDGASGDVGEYLRHAREAQSFYNAAVPDIQNGETDGATDRPDRR